MPRLYISGPATGSDRFLEEEAYRAHHRLFSVHKKYLNDVLLWLEKAHSFRRIPKTIMLDSGAFTAWNLGKKTTLQEVIDSYTRFMQAAQGMFDEIWLINLDVIPGKKGIDPTPQQINEAIKESDENFKQLQNIFGARILPVFHQGEHTERLFEVAEQAEFICISPRNDLNEGVRASWALDVHNSLTKKYTHGLATTGMIMLTVPWFSVDSATSIHVATFGQLIFAIGGRMYKLFVTLDTDKHKLKDKHLYTVVPHLQQQCLDLISRDIFELEILQTNFKARVLFNIEQLTAFTESVKIQTNEQNQLFTL